MVSSGVESDAPSTDAMSPSSVQNENGNRFFSRFFTYMRFSSKRPTDVRIPPCSADPGDNFRINVRFNRRDLGKEPGQIALDTQADANLISRRMVTRLGLEPHKCEPRALFPLYFGSKRSAFTSAEEVEVEWHKEDGKKTFCMMFRVVDIPRYDCIVGWRDIRKYGLLQLGKGLEDDSGIMRSTVCRDSNVS